MPVEHCPACRMRIIVKANGTCPSCRHRIREAQPGVLEREELERQQRALARRPNRRPWLSERRVWSASHKLGLYGGLAVGFATFIIEWLGHGVLTGLKEGVERAVGAYIIVLVFTAGFLGYYGWLLPKEPDDDEGA